MELVNGVDIVKVSRIKDSYEKYGEKFLDRIYTEYEKEYIFKKKYFYETMAGLYAGKEAVAKAIGTGIGQITFKDIEIKHDEKGKPFVNISDEIKERFNIKYLTLSISHEREYAIGFVIGGI